jgi:hypothetical protein
MARRQQEHEMEATAVPSSPSKMTAELLPAVRPEDAKGFVNRTQMISALVDAWFIDTFHNRPSYSVEEFNRLQEAKKTLKDSLRRVP